MKSKQNKKQQNKYKTNKQKQAPLPYLNSATNQEIGRKRWELDTF